LRSLLLLAALPLCADGLGDLRLALRKLPGVEPAKVAFDYQYWREIQESKHPVVTQGSVQAQVEDGPQGLRITWDRPTLALAEAELQVAFDDPTRPAPVSQIMRSLTALDIDEHMHGAQTLARDLTGARLLETRSEDWKGKPATVLVLQLEAVIHPNIRKAVKDVKATGWVWLSPDGTPLAFRTDVTYKGSRFLISFQGTQKEEIHYQRKGNRLLVTWAQNEERTSGFGDSMATKRVYRITGL
jgi:hypothetical protein